MMNTNIANKTVSYLTFLIGNNIFGVPVQAVQNIVEMSRVSKSHEPESAFWGSISHRGGSVPVLDKRLKMSNNQKQYTDNTCVVVIELEHTFEQFTVGLIVDALQEVVDVNLISIKQPSNSPDFVAGIHLHENRGAIKLINPLQLFTETELYCIKHFTNEQI